MCQHDLFSLLIFGSIQINKNYRSAMHLDKNNLGPSYIMGLGDYTEGKLWGLHMGAVDVKEQWVQFDGNIAHCTLPFSGTRYSLIYFTHQRYGKANLADQNFVTKELQFNWPRPGLVKIEYYTTPEQRMAEGKEAFAWWERCQKDGKLFSWPRI